MAAKKKSAKRSTVSESPAATRKVAREARAASKPAARAKGKRKAGKGASAAIDRAFKMGRALGRLEASA